MRDSDHELAPRGEGASVSVEFNMLYRWHATTSAPDAAWIGAAFEKMMPGKPYTDITPQDFAKAARTFLVPDRDLRKWAPAG
jgi:linoleate 10R-lipoxygenase